MPRVWAKLGSDAAAQARAHDRPPGNTKIPALISLGQLQIAPRQPNPRTYVTDPQDGGAIDQLHYGGAKTPLVGGNPWSNNNFGGSYSVS
ncbi:hypothetical protein N7504_001906 [Penicillium tannophilum]|nr:hypothetical protein N7504_001906 [Penicillium tannophilum]